MANAISLQKDRAAFTIFDRATYEYYDKTLPKIAPKEAVPKPMNFKSLVLDDIITEVQERGYKYFYRTDTIEELCTQSGIDLNGLRNTIAEYNKFCKMGCDEFLGKDPKNLRPIKKPPFYAARLCIGAYNTVGGIKINYKTEVIDKNGEVIPGLYAAGNDANTLYAGTYVPLAGNFVGFAVNSGRMAAENALEYIKSIDN